jgi:hypothetical protein
MMEQSKESPGGVQIRLLELKKQINIAFSRVLTARE